jgi:formylglycine-generating enzyme required for sulfatase activity
MIDAGPGCAGTAGPTMVDVGGYCIDSTEVTNTHYAAFLTATSNDTSGQIAACAANADYTPAVADWATNEPTNKPGHPVGWVDWCDAYAYCAWAGKRLCGRIGGGAASYSEYATANVSQWHGACTAGGTQTYPYGNAFQLTSCNTRGSDGSGSSDGTTGTVLGRLPVGAKTSCQGGTAGVFDMSGNVLEWADECNGPNFTSRCHTRGGNSYASDQNARCDWSSDGQRSYTYEHLGFRCCSN